VVIPRHDMLTERFFQVISFSYIFHEIVGLIHVCALLTLP